MNGEAGKGDVPRPLSVPRSEYEENWERAFGKQAREDVTVYLDTMNHMREQAQIEREEEIAQLSKPDPAPCSICGKLQDGTVGGCLAFWNKPPR